MVRILVLTEHYLPRFAGTVTHVENLTRALAKAQVEVFLAVPSTGPVNDPCQEEDSFGRFILRVPVGVDGTSDELRRKNYIERCTSEMPTWVKKFSPDLIHVMYGHYVYSSLEEVRIPKIWTCHNVPPQEYHLPWNEESRVGRFFNALYSTSVAFKHRRLIRSYPYEYIVAVSEATGRLLKERVGLSEEKIVVIANGVRPITVFASVNKPLNGRIRLLTVGGMKKHKGIHHVVSIGQNLLKAGFDFEWHLVGPHSNRQYVFDVQQQIAAQGLSERMIWDGAVSDASLDEQYRNAHIYVHLASQEGFCLTVLEALATGVPVVGTRVGAIPEMIAKGSGVVVEPEPLSIATGLIETIQSYSQLKKGRELGESIQRCFGWQAVAGQTVSVYRSVLGVSGS